MKDGLRRIIAWVHRRGR